MSRHVAGCGRTDDQTDWLQDSARSKYRILKGRRIKKESRRDWRFNELGEVFLEILGKLMLATLSEG